MCILVNKNTSCYLFIFENIIYYKANNTTIVKKIRLINNHKKVKLIMKTVRLVK